MSRKHKKVTYQFDVAGICEKLAQAGGVLSKRDLRRARHYLERQYPGRWYVEYERLKDAGIIIESGRGQGAKGSPTMVRLCDAALAHISNG